MKRYFVFLGDRDEDDNPTMVGMEFVGYETSLDAVETLAYNLSADFYNRDIYLFEGKLIAQAVGDDILKPVMGEDEIDPKEEEEEEEEDEE